VANFGPSIDFEDEEFQEWKERTAMGVEGQGLLDKFAAEDAAIDKQKQLKAAYVDTGLAAVSSFASISSAITDNAAATAAASLIETVAYQAVAVARAFAEGGPFAGPVAAAVAVGAIGAQLATLAKVSGVGGGESGGGSGGGGGGGRRSGGRSSGGRGDKDIAVVMQYEHRGFDSFFQDYEKSGRGGRGRQRNRTAGR
jgi:uncharacterized membrane protein YgcG